MRVKNRIRALLSEQYILLSEEAATGERKKLIFSIAIPVVNISLQNKHNRVGNVTTVHNNR